MRRHRTVGPVPRHTVADESAIETALVHEGAVVVTGVDTTRAGLLGLAHRLGRVRPTHYGSDWELATDPASPHLVEGAAGLRPHTDLPYAPIPPRRQVLLCVEPARAGGANILVDGWALLSELRQTDPATWSALVGAAVTFVLDSVGGPLYRTGPPVEVGDGAASMLVRHAPDLVRTDDGEARAALDAVTALSLEPSRQRLVELGAGDALVVDNHRTLHGRTPITDPGRRRLLGCYVDTSGPGTSRSRP
ncbi:MAG: hypothetical protein D6683_06320 [Actinomyces sp.]|nr:MAG: hypothetical protein D6683_06320 [Actinomyces sp.]